jgi:hypothetical protein
MEIDFIMKTVAVILGIVLAFILSLVIGGGLLVLIAYGAGWLANYFMGFEPFQATVLGLAGVFTFVMLTERVFKGLDLMSYKSNSIDDEYDEYDEDDWFDEDEDNDEFDADIIEDQEVLDKLYPGIPRWRRPTKTVDFSNTQPDDRCPCGSGRKYKNCHGSKSKKK